MYFYNFYKIYELFYVNLLYVLDKTQIFSQIF